jgi:hypothetical protein
MVAIWLCCCCFPSVNTICGRIMIGLSLSFFSKHNMLSCYDWVVDHILCLLTENNNNTIILQPYIVFTEIRQRQPNHNTTTYCVYWRKTINPIIIRPHVVFSDGRQERQPNHDTTTYCVYWRLCCCPPSVNTICGRIMIGLSLSSVSKQNMWSCYDWVVVIVVCH